MNAFIFQSTPSNTTLNWAGVGDGLYQINRAFTVQLTGDMDPEELVVSPLTWSSVLFSASSGCDPDGYEFPEAQASLALAVQPSEAQPVSSTDQPMPAPATWLVLVGLVVLVRRIRA